MYSSSQDSDPKESLSDNPEPPEHTYSTLYTLNYDSISENSGHH